MLQELNFELTNLSIHFLLSELKPFLEGSFMNKMQLIDKNVFKLRIHSSEKGNHDLIIIIPKMLFLASYQTNAKHTKHSFLDQVNKQLKRRRIIEFNQMNLERIIQMKFEEYNLYIEFFSKGNIIFTDSKDIILGVLRPESWSARKLRKGETYILPPSKGVSPFDLNFNGFKELISKSEKNIVRSLISQVSFPPMFAEQVLIDSNVDKEKLPSSLSEKEMKNLFESISKIINSKNITPEILEFNKKNYLIPFNLSSFETKKLKEKNLNEAINNVFSSSLESEENTEQEEHSAATKSAERKLERLKEGLQTLKDKTDLNKIKAEIIRANFILVDSALREFKNLMNQKKGKEDIMRKLSSEFPFIKEIDLKTKEMIVELE